MTIEMEPGDVFDRLMTVSLPTDRACDEDWNRILNARYLRNLHDR